MFSKNFIDIVRKANQGTKEFYKDKNNFELPNPYYIGFGNPNSEILILGKEKGFDLSNKEQLYLENINNPNEWSHYVENEIFFNKTKYNETSQHYLNAYFPYNGKMKSGHTWNKYSKLTSELLNDIELTENNSFLEHVFISEINHIPSRLSKIKQFNVQTRIDFLKNDFYKSFKTIILSCGNYLSNKKIEEIFDVKLGENYSKPREKLLIFKNGNRKLILTRQLSMDVSNDFISLIAYNLKNEKQT